jgi:hypothetical protein
MTKFPESVSTERRVSGMPGFNVADDVTCHVRGVNFVGLHHPTGMQKPRHDGSAKACRRYGFRKFSLDSRSFNRQQ